jgi:hypothetical protein
VEGSVGAASFAGVSTSARPWAAAVSITAGSSNGEQLEQQESTKQLGYPLCHAACKSGTKRCSLQDVRWLSQHQRTWAVRRRRHDLLQKGRLLRHSPGLVAGRVQGRDLPEAKPNTHLC